MCARGPSLVSERIKEEEKTLASFSGLKTSGDLTPSNPAWARPIMSSATAPPTRPATPLECALPSWLPHLAPATFETILVPLPPDLAAYLAAGQGVWLAGDSRAVRFLSLFCFVFDMTRVCVCVCVSASLLERAAVGGAGAAGRERKPAPT